MTHPREAFLQRVREAVRAGNRAGSVAAAGPAGTVGDQGGGPDPVQRFCEQLTAAGGHAHIVPAPAAAVARVLGLVLAGSARRALVGRGSFVDSLALPDHLRAAGVEV